MNSEIALIALSETVMQEGSQPIPSNDIIGIGGIIATLIVGVLTCVVTWRLTLKSIKLNKISYSIQMYPIISRSVTGKSELNFEDMEIKYKDKTLRNPCLLTLEITNIGNEAISNPPIRISNTEDVEIIPGYFIDVPNGYEALWELEKGDKYACNIKLDHINPKQVVKARFFMDNLPIKINFECPMPNIQIQETMHTNGNKMSSKGQSYSKANLVLIAVTVLLFITINQWTSFISEVSYFSGIYLPPIGASAFIMSVFLFSIILNAFGVPKIDTYIQTHKSESKAIKWFLIIVCIILLIMIVFDYVIVNRTYQVITAIVISVLLATLIHIICISGS